MPLNLRSLVGLAAATAFVAFSSGCGSEDRRIESDADVWAGEDLSVADPGNTEIAGTDEGFEVGVVKENRIVFRPNVLQVDDESELQVLGREEDGAVLLKRNAAGLALQVGDILVAEPEKGNVFGKIAKVEVGADFVRIWTNIPRLDEVFDELKYHLPLVTDFSNATFGGELADLAQIVDSPMMQFAASRSMSGGSLPHQPTFRTLQIAKSVRVPLPPGYTILGATLKNHMGHEITIEVKVKSGEIEIQPSGTAAKDWPHWVQADFETRIKMTMVLQAEISGSFRLLDGERDDILQGAFFFFSVPFGIPGVWVDLAAKLKWALEVDLEGATSIEWTQGQEYLTKGGLLWIRGEEGDGAYFQHSSTATAKDLEVGFSADIAIRTGPKCEMSIRPWSVVGVGLSLFPYLGALFGGESVTGESWAVGYKIVGGIKAALFADIGLLGVEIAKIERTLAKYEETIASGEWASGCTKNCSGRECGPDPVCGESCGTCTGGKTCNSSGQCVAEACVPNCSGRECGADPTCGESCGTCTGGKTCNSSGQCVSDACVPDCSGRECGPDPVCGESCGTCTGTDTCNDAGQCVPTGCVGNCGEMVTVPAGPFIQGCNESVDTQCSSAEKPYHEVNVPAFEIDKYEVTIDLYGDCVNAGACSAPRDSSYCNWNKAGKEEHPVNCITWFQAGAYCTWAGKRLCSESEWEKASRGTDGRKYPWGNETATCEYAVMDEGGDGCGTDSTWPVGSKPAGASPYGAMDMSGNVWEWVEDDYHWNYTGAPTNGSAWVDDPRASYRVRRGGSLAGYDYLRSSGRSAYDPADFYDFGVRCCRSK